MTTADIKPTHIAGDTLLSVVQWRDLGYGIRKGSKGIKSNAIDKLGRPIYLFAPSQTRPNQTPEQRRANAHKALMGKPAWPDDYDYVMLLFAKRGIMPDDCRDNYMSYLDIKRKGRRIALRPGAVKRTIPGIRVRVLRETILSDGAIRQHWRPLALWHVSETVPDTPRHRPSPKGRAAACDAAAIGDHLQA